MIRGPYWRMAPDPDLRAVYEAAIYEVHFPGRTVHFRVGDPAPEPVEPFAIITAWNPGHERPSRAENDAANQRLEADLRAAGLRYLRSLSFERTPELPTPEGPNVPTPEELHHAEPGFAVFGIDIEAALALARRYRQAAILCCDGRRAELRWVDP